jgi:catechol 2,3-dioxygenase-like lactoylglutathione lyase family enzyme
MSARRSALVAAGIAALLSGCAVTINDYEKPRSAVAPVAHAPPPPGANAIDPIPTAIRRTTIIVRDIDTSLKLYRDVLGLKVNYDAPMTVSGPAFTQNGPPRPIRLVLLNGNDNWIGWIGLLQYTDDPKRPATPPPAYLGLGSHVIVTHVKDATAVCEGAAKVPGVRITAPLKLQEYPGRNGGPVIRVRGCQLFDPDGAYLELNEQVK